MSDGICDFSIDGDYDGDQAKFMDERTMRARKPHTCYECGEPIAVGAKYVRVVGKWETSLDTYKFCLPCQEAAGEFFDGARTFGVLWDEMTSNWEHGAHLQACLNRLVTAEAKDHMRRRWLKWKGIA